MTYPSLFRVSMGHNRQKLNQAVCRRRGGKKLNEEKHTCPTGWERSYCSICYLQPPSSPHRRIQMHTHHLVNVSTIKCIFDWGLAGTRDVWNWLCLASCKERGIPGLHWSPSLIDLVVVAYYGYMLVCHREYTVCSFMHSHWFRMCGQVMCMRMEVAGQITEIMCVSHDLTKTQTKLL